MSDNYSNKKRFGCHASIPWYGITECHVDTKPKKMCLIAERIKEKNISINDRHFECMYWQEIRVRSESER